MTTRPPVRPPDPRPPARRAPPLAALGALTVGLTACAELPEGGPTAVDRAGAAARSRADNTAPTGFLTLAGGGRWSRTLRPTVELHAEDDVGVTEVCLSAGLRCRFQPMRDTFRLSLADRPGAQVVRARFRDAAGNTSDEVQLSVQVDRRPPTVGGLSAEASPGAITVRWTGLADEGSGVAGVRLVGAPGARAPACSNEGALLYEGSLDHVVLTGLPAGPTSLRLCAEDAVGNRSAPVVARVEALAEADPPVITRFLIEDDAPTTHQREVALRVEVADASPVTGLCLTEDPALTADRCAPWLPLEAAAVHTLSGGEGEKQLRAWARDAYGNVSAAATDTVLFDRTAPDNGALSGAATFDTVDLSWSGFSDRLSGISGYVVVEAAETAPADCRSGVERYRGPDLQLQLFGQPVGRRAYRVCAIDGAGNLSSGATARVTVEPSPVPPVVTRFDTADGAHVSAERTLSLVIEGTSAAPLTRMCLAEGLSCSVWTPFSATPTLRLSRGDGPKTLSLWLRDAEGVESRAPARLEVELIEDLCAGTPATTGLRVDASCTASFPMVSSWDVVEEWGTRAAPYAELPSWTRIMATPAIGQLTDDNLDGLINDEDVPDVVFSTFTGSRYHGYPGALRVLSGDGGAVHFSVQDVVDPVTGRASTIAPSGGVALGDIDNDGLTDIVTISTDRRAVALEGDGAVKWVSEVVGASGYTAPSLADIDGDGDVEIIAAGHVLHSDGRLAFALGSAALGFTYAADLDRDGQMELIAGNLVHNSDGSRRWTQPAIGAGTTAVADFDGDGEGEVVVHASSWMALIDGDGALLWRVDLMDGGSGAPCVADFDGDGLPEVAAAGRGRMTMVEHDGTIKWWRPTQDNSSSVTGCSAFDFDADGVAEVVYADEIDLHLYDGPTGIDKWTQPDHASGTLYEYPLIADVDGDGSTEIIVPNNNYAFAGVDGLTVYGERNDGWANARQSWNQFSYFVENIDDDMHVGPADQWPYDGHNSFRAQQPPTGDINGAPDLRPHFWGLCADCSEGEVQVLVSVDNVGTAFAPRGTSVALYAVEVDGSLRLIDVQGTARRVDPGSRSRSLRLSVPVADWPTYGMRVVVDDDGAGHGRERECAEDNNALDLALELSCR